MKPLPLLLILCLPLLNVAQTPEPVPLTNERVIELVQGGIHVDELTRIIGTAPGVAFLLTPSGTDKLQLAGVSEDTVKVMAAREHEQGSPTGQVRLPGGRPRVFVTDSPNAWSPDGTKQQYRLASGAHPQTAEIEKTIGRECPNATVTNSLQRADYVVVLERETKGMVWRHNKMVIFNHEGDMVYSDSTRALGSAVRDGCSAFE